MPGTRKRARREDADVSLNAVRNALFASPDGAGVVRGVQDTRKKNAERRMEDAIGNDVLAQALRQIPDEHPPVVQKASTVPLMMRNVQALGVNGSYPKVPMAAVLNNANNAAPKLAGQPFFPPSPSHWSPSYRQQVLLQQQQPLQHHGQPLFNWEKSPDGVLLSNPLQQQQIPHAQNPNSAPGVVALATGMSKSSPHSELEMDNSPTKNPSTTNNNGSGAGAAQTEIRNSSVLEQRYQKLQEEIQKKVKSWKKSSDENEVVHYQRAMRKKRRSNKQPETGGPDTTFGAKAFRYPEGKPFTKGLPLPLLELIPQDGPELDRLKFQKLKDVTSMLQETNLHVLEPLTLYNGKELFDLFATIAEVWKNSGKAAWKKRINKIKENARIRKSRQVLDEHETREIEMLQQKIEEREAWERAEMEKLKVEKEIKKGIEKKRRKEAKRKPKKEK